MNKVLRPVYRTLTAPFRWIRKAYTLLSLQTSSWFVALSSSWTDSSYMQLAHSGLRNPYVARAIALLAGQLSTVPLQAERMERDEMETIDDHPFLMLLKRPNKDVGYQKLMRRLIEHFVFGGEAFFYAPEAPINGPNIGRPLDGRLFLLRPDRITEILRDETTDEIVGYRYNPFKGNTRILEAAHIKHVKPIDDPEKNDERGVPLMLAAWRAVQLMEAGEDWNKSVSQNKGRIPGFFKYTGDGLMTEDQFKRTKEGMQEAYMKDSEESRPGLLDGDFSWVETAQKMTDADFLGADALWGRKIAVALGIPSALLGDAERQTYSNMKAAVQELVQFTVLPLLDFVLDEWNAWYLGKYEPRDATLGYSRKDVDALQEDQNEEFGRLGKAVADGILTINEAREEIGYEARDDEAADVLFLPFSLEPAERRLGAAGPETALLSLSDEAFDAYVAKLLDGTHVTRNGR